MRKLFLSLIVSITILGCNSEKSQDKNEKIIERYIEYTNIGNRVGIDSLLSKDFKLYSDSNIIERDDLLNTIVAAQFNANFNRQIVEISHVGNIVKTKENMTNDYINTFNFEPMYRTREYHIDENNKIQSINNIEQYEPENYQQKVDKFHAWANENYKQIYDKMIKLESKGENYNSELNYLLSKIKNEGIEIIENNELDKNQEKNSEIESSKTQENNEVKYISTTLFSKTVIGKTKSQIKEKYGKPCYVQTLSVYLVWYYGSLHCGKNRTIIYDEDSEKEVSMAQIQFSGKVAITVNYF